MAAGWTLEAIRQSSKVVSLLFGKMLYFQDSGLLDHVIKSIRPLENKNDKSSLRRASIAKVVV